MQNLQQQLLAAAMRLRQVLKEVQMQTLMLGMI
jgi:hypothetical protein